jgi:hypothetical protein
MECQKVKAVGRNTDGHSTNSAKRALMANDDFKIRGDVEKSDFCPLLLAAWICHYGADGKNGKMGELCKCGVDCALFSRETWCCALQGLLDSGGD